MWALHRGCARDGHKPDFPLPPGACAVCRWSINTPGASSAPGSGERSRSRALSGQLKARSSREVCFVVNGKVGERCGSAQGPRNRFQTQQMRPNSNNHAEYIKSGNYAALRGTAVVGCKLRAPGPLPPRGSAACREAWASWSSIPRPVQPGGVKPSSPPARQNFIFLCKGHEPELVF